MEKLLSRFSHEETGSSTVDWLVLGVGLLSLTVALTASVGAAQQTYTTDGGQPASAPRLETSI